MQDRQQKPEQWPPYLQGKRAASDEEEDDVTKVTDTTLTSSTPLTFPEVSKQNVIEFIIECVNVEVDYMCFAIN